MNRKDARICGCYMRQPNCLNNETTRSFKYAISGDSYPDFISVKAGASCTNILGYFVGDDEASSYSGYCFLQQKVIQTKIEDGIKKARIKNTWYHAGGTFYDSVFTSVEAPMDVIEILILVNKIRLPPDITRYISEFLDLIYEKRPLPTHTRFHERSNLFLSGQGGAKLYTETDL